MQKEGSKLFMHTTPLAQLEAKPSKTTNNNSESGMSFQQMLPNLLINAGAPFLINMLAQPHMSTIDALLLASSVPALYTLAGLIRKKHIDVLGVLVVAGLLLTALFALLFQSPRLLLLQSSAVSGLLGVVMLISLLFPRPAMFYLIRSIMAQNNPQRLAYYNEGWAIPQIRSFYRVLTAFWGCVTVAQVALHTILAFTLPIPLMLTLGPILSFGVIIPAAHWSMHYFRKNRPIFNQLRQQRVAQAATIAR
ncbi:MAG TPA: VC0807 family protein [Ktedonobacteraceae bacterium]|nr:VC0807 family protein [Ktedonobacteraceae bacterium]